MQCISSMQQTAHLAPPSFSKLVSTNPWTKSIETFHSISFDVNQNHQPNRQFGETISDSERDFDHDLSGDD